jgi:hypothetical protein
MAIRELTNAELQHWEQLAAEGLEAAGSEADHLPGFDVVFSRNRSRTWKRIGFGVLAMVLSMLLTWFGFHSTKGVEAKAAVRKERSSFALISRAQEFIPKRSLDSAKKLVAEKSEHEVEPTERNLLEMFPAMEYRGLPKFTNQEPPLRLRNSAVAHHEIRWIEHCKVYVYEVQNIDGFLPEHIGVWRENDLDADSMMHAATKFDDGFVAMSKALKCVYAGDFMSAKEILEPLHQQYKSDVNVLFYLAFSEYKLHEKTQAAEHFQAVRKLDLSAFQEEGMFYHALCLYDGVQHADAVLLLNMLVQNDGAYAKRAACILDFGFLRCSEM